eukprot:NODE_230_length_12188_cov_0.969890.p9 type:complete len:144 gc:universal NODE_230_length_12188_cov_0.969890:7477-7046(-)
MHFGTLMISRIIYLFSWGETRLIAGIDRGHDEQEGLFDSSKIVMKRYAEWKQLQKRGVVLRDQLVSAGVANTDGHLDSESDVPNTQSYFRGGYNNQGMSSVTTVPSNHQQNQQFNGPAMFVPGSERAMSPIELERLQGYRSYQ